MPCADTLEIQKFSMKINTIKQSSTWKEIAYPFFEFFPGHAIQLNKVNPKVGVADVISVESYKSLFMFSFFCLYARQKSNNGKFYLLL